MSTFANIIFRMTLWISKSNDKNFLLEFWYPWAKFKYK